jgi:excisionase family DNA binding protein
MKNQSSYSGFEQPRPLAYSIKEAARAIGISRSSVYTEITEGRLRVRKSGRRSLIFDVDLSAWLKSLPEKSFRASQHDKPKHKHHK